MKRNWYALYTRPDREKKVASLLTKRRIKNYIPVNNIITLQSGNKKAVKEPLFGAYVFVYISDAEIASIKEIPGVVNFLHWLNKPAIIKWEEIEAVRQLTASYNNILLEKSVINITDTVRIIDEPIISFKENSASVRFQTLRIVLPSLGYTMVAERDKVREETSKEEVLTSSVFFPKSLNSFFSN